MLLLSLLQINLDPGKGEFSFDQQALKLEYVPPASSGEVERAAIQIMDKGEKEDRLIKVQNSSKTMDVPTFALLVPCMEVRVASLSVTMAVAYSTVHLIACCDMDGMIGIWTGTGRADGNGHALC